MLRESSAASLWLRVCLFLFVIPHAQDSLWHSWISRCATRHVANRNRCEDLGCWHHVEPMSEKWQACSGAAGSNDAVIDICFSHTVYSKLLEALDEAVNWVIQPQQFEVSDSPAPSSI